MPPCLSCEIAEQPRQLHYKFACLSYTSYAQSLTYGRTSPAFQTACIKDGFALALQKESSPSAYASWYPPVQQTLLCLSKLYRCVEAKVFAGLAQDAVSSCTKAVQVGKAKVPYVWSVNQALQSADPAVEMAGTGTTLCQCLSDLRVPLCLPEFRSKLGTCLQEAAKAVQRRSSAMDGQLFLIKQLLILREQIAPFEADFSVVEKDLDFTHMRDHLRRILAGVLSAI